ncbi:TPA: NUMOD4 domain-containing protein [Streptococcus suis]
MKNYIIKDEKWEDIEQFEGYYQVSNFGRIRSCDRYITEKTGKVNFLRGKPLKNHIGDDGYYKVVLTKNNKPHYFRVCRLVAKAFIDNPENKPQVNHIDGNKINDHVSNLEWVTVQENITHSIKTGLKPVGEDCVNVKLKEKDVIEIRRLYANGEKNQVELAAMYNVTQGNIGFVVRRKIWKHVG